MASAANAGLLSEKEFVAGGCSSRVGDCCYFVFLFMVIGGGMATGHLLYIIPAFVIAVLLMGYLFVRPTGWKVCINDNTISYTKYRVWGLLGKTQQFALSEIGFVVLDCRRGKWFRPSCGLNGNWRFNGIYATRGFPTPSRPMEIAFELPTSCWFHSGAFASNVLESHQKMYQELCEALHCKTGVHSEHAAVGPDFFPLHYGWITTSEMYQNQVAGYGNILVACLEKAQDFRVGMCVARDLPTNTWNIDVNEDCMRTTIVVHADQDPNLSLPERMGEP